MDAGWLNQAEPVGNQQQHEQQDGKSHAQHQGVDGTIGFALVAHHEQEGKGKTAKDQQEGKGNDDLHGRDEVVTDRVVAAQGDASIR
jgi:hypothetical protein